MGGRHSIEVARIEDSGRPRREVLVVTPAVVLLGEVCAYLGQHLWALLWARVVGR